MKNFIEWFKNSNKVKRWMFLVLLGMILFCYGISNMLVTTELLLKDVLKVLITFVFGLTFFIIGLVHIQRRSLEIVIEANSTKKSEDIDLKTLVSKKEIYEKGPKIVVIGGGTGLNTILDGLKKYTSNLTAIVDVSSYGISPTFSRKELELQPLDNIKESFVALSLKEQEMSALINYKFEKGKLKDLFFGDIYLSAMQNIYSDFAYGIGRTNNVLSIVGDVLPITLDEMNICAELLDGSVVEEKSKIPETVGKKITKINRVYLSPANLKVGPNVLERINEADAIIIAPGSLYTNVIPNLLVRNVAKTIKESKGKKIYISNIMTEHGQTDDYSVSEHIKAILEHTGEGLIDYCLCDYGEVIPEYIRKYNLYGSYTVELDVPEIKELGIKPIKDSFATIIGGTIRHDSDVVARKIVEMIVDEMKFKDEQYDEQFVLLNTKLKEENEKNKGKHSKGSKNKKVKFYTKKRGRSKFNIKYQERIESIKKSEKKNRRK